MKHARSMIPYCLGGFFCLSAVLKAISFDQFTIQVAYFGFTRQQGLVHWASFGVIGIETALGAALIICRGRQRRWLWGAAGILTFAFTVLIAYGWLFRGLSDCGCFGKYLKLTPGWSILKNIALMGIIATSWLAEQRASNFDALHDAQRSYWRQCGAIVGVVALMVIFTTLSARPAMKAPASGKGIDAVTTTSVAGKSRIPGAKSQVNETKFSSYVVQSNEKRIVLAHGIYLVAMLSGSCEQCAEYVDKLNRLAEDTDMPQIVAFVLGTDADVKTMRERNKPRFPTQAMEMHSFLERIGKSPPRIYLIKDGRELKYWDGPIPDAVTIAQTILQASALRESKF